MARKVNRNLAAAAAAAIAAVYGTGYVWTQPAYHANGAQSAATQTALPDTATAIARSIATATPTLAPPATTSIAPTAIPRSAAAATPSPAPPTATAAATYRDGTYTGTGTSRRGDITASVTIQNGQVTVANITRSTTYYPISDIARLQAQVVQRQSANVDFVSGATESSRAFRGAVTQALAQARVSGAAAAVVSGRNLA